MKSELLKLSDLRGGLIKAKLRFLMSRDCQAGAGVFQLGGDAPRAWKQDL